jgi:hypothetical protein
MFLCDDILLWCLYSYLVPSSPNLFGSIAKSLYGSMFLYDEILLWCLYCYLVPGSESLFAMLGIVSIEIADLVRKESKACVLGVNFIEMTYVAVGISCTGPLGEKQGYLPYPSGCSRHSTSLSLGHL